MDTPLSGPKRYVGRYLGSVPPEYYSGRADSSALQRRNYVLVVDDDPFFRSLFKLMLGQTGCPLSTIWEAEQSETAIEICNTKPVDLVFCDLNLPLFSSQDGLETICEIRKLRPSVPAYMVTAENSESLIRQVRAVGANGHLLKPINLAVLKKVLVLNLGTGVSRSF